MHVRKSIALTLTLAFLAIAPAAANASAEDDGLTPEEARAPYSAEQLLVDPESTDSGPATTGGGDAAQRGGFTITCTPTADKPHWSSGAKGVIYKTRVVCVGTGDYPPTATIRVKGGLFWDSARYNGDTSNGVNWSQLRTSDETRVVNVNGSTNTFYTPKIGQTGATFQGHYQGTSTVQITTPTGQIVGANTSIVGFITPP